jgi:CRP/FNR family transcriptional regulator, cyclic AMP receptor protein
MSTTPETVAAHPFLAGLSHPWLERLAGHAEPVTLDPGHRLFHEHERGDSFWLICSGEITLDCAVPGGDPVAVRSAGPGEVIGWSWIFPPHQWDYGAVAASRTSALEFDAAGVRRLMDDDEALGRQLSTRFVRVVMERLYQARQNLPDLYRRRLQETGASGTTPEGSATAGG